MAEFCLEWGTHCKSKSAINTIFLEAKNISTTWPHAAQFDEKAKHLFMCSNKSIGKHYVQRPFLICELSEMCNCTTELFTHTLTVRV